MQVCTIPREMIICISVSGIGGDGAFLAVKRIHMRGGWYFNCILRARSGPEYRSGIFRYSLVWFGVG